MTRELIEIRGKRVKDIQIGLQFIAILTEGMVCEQLLMYQGDLIYRGSNNGAAFHSWHFQMHFL